MQLSGQQVVHRALQSDEEGIFGTIQQIVGSKQDTEAVLRLRNDDAQDFIDIIQMVRHSYWPRLLDLWRIRRWTKVTTTTRSLRVGQVTCAENLLRFPVASQPH